jgi:DNA-binding LacI/PurR family transcriptional regulator
MDKLSPLNLIANLLGVSKMTVSRALREGTSVAPELRAKIRECARKLGYQPDSRISQVMRAVRKAQTSSYRETLAFIWTHRLSERDERKSSLHEEFEGASRRAQQLGYRLDVFRVTDESLTGNSLSHILNSRGIRGVLISPPGFEGTHPHLRLDWKQFCCVLLDEPFANDGLPRVLHDHYSGCVLTLRRLKRLLYERIGLVMSHTVDERSARLIRSAFTSFHPMNSKEAEKLIFTGEKYDSKALKKWMTQYKPDVIVAHFEDAFPTLEQVREHTPKDTAITALNWDKSRPEIAGIDQHRSIIGEQAVDLLLLRLQGNQFGLDPLAPSIKVPGSWVDGTSIRKEKASPTPRVKPVV